MKYPLEVVVCRTALSLFRNISANDVLKTKLLQEGGLRLVLGCMSQHEGDKTLQVWADGVVRACVRVCEGTVGGRRVFCFFLSVGCLENLFLWVAP